MVNSKRRAGRILQSIWRHAAGGPVCVGGQSRDERVGLYHVAQMSMTLCSITIKPSGLRVQSQRWTNVTAAEAADCLPLYANVEW